MVNSGRLETENNAASLLLKRGGPALIGLCLRSVACRETVISKTAYAAISAATTALIAANPLLDKDQAQILAVIQYITSPTSTEPLPGKPGEPVPPLPIPPGQNGGNENVAVPGKPGDGHTPIGVPGQENNGSGGGTTTTTPMPEPQGPQLILSEGANKGSLSGPPTRIPPLSDEATTRSLVLENQSAIALAKHGFEVVQNPVVPGPKNPDYLINGQIFDNYAPSTGNVRNMATYISEKVQGGQTNNMVVNLTDSPATPDALQTQLVNYPVPGLQQVIVIDQSGAIFRLNIKVK